MHVDSSRPSFGLACQRATRARMTVAHQHDDIELNLAATSLRYRIDGAEVEIPGGRLAAFWAARPHQLIDNAPDEWVQWLTVPLGMFLSWTITPGLSAALLRGEVVLLDGDGGGPPPMDRLTHWASDLSTADPWARDTVQLELEAYFRRLGFATLHLVQEPKDLSSPRPSLLAGRMAEFIAARSAEPITVADVARSVHVHPGYAMTVFRRAVGTTIGSYLTQCRIAHAQRLLITSTLPIAEIGPSVGFQSQSQFYDRFGAACGTTPGAYRRAHAAPA